jgi:hypothetical protein
MKPSKVLTIKILLSIIIFLLILGYGLFQARNLIIGPSITVLTPKNGDNVANPLVVVTGIATNITRISLNDRQIFVDKKGSFSEKLLVPSGYTIIKLAAQDKFGRTTQKLVELNYTGSASGTDSINASSTIATSSATSTQDIIQ